MIHKTLAVSLGLVLMSSLAGCSHHDNSMDSMKMKDGDGSMSAVPATMPAAMAYTCPMHPDVISSTPGKCPKCGMPLVAKH